MDYPFWDSGIGYGVLMGSIAVLHVFISHFAIGGGLYLVVSERSARKAGDSPRLEYLEQLSRFFVLTTLVLGALTGVGIWFIIGLLNPAATEALIRTFVWGWATEWTMFVVEIAAAILYFYGWKRMSPAAHMTLGWIYFVAAWLSLFVINGILTFMLTPGGWLGGGGFWQGFFNPTFWPSLVLRTGICIVLAGFYAFIVAARLRDPGLKARQARYNAAWSLSGLVVAAAGMAWYLRAIPQELMKAATEQLLLPFSSLQYFYFFSAASFLVLFALAFLMGRRLHIAGVTLLMVLALASFGSFEWFRESLRKPWVIAGYMYANGIQPSRIDALRSSGLLASMPFRSGDDGADLFRRSCGNCHTINGYKPLRPVFDGTDQAFVVAIVKGIHLLRGQMPPFAGTAAEAEKLGAWVHARVDQRPFGEVYPLQGVDLGRKVFEIRCGRCHVPGGVGDKTESLAGMSADDYNGMLDIAGDLGEGMPAFTAGTPERAALVQYLQTIGKGAQK